MSHIISINNMKTLKEYICNESRTADFIVAKDNVKSNLEVATEILSIIRNVFGK